jgi:hypothetical protein
MLCDIIPCRHDDHDHFAACPSTECPQGVCRGAKVILPLKIIFCSAGNNILFVEKNQRIS